MKYKWLWILSHKILYIIIVIKCEIMLKLSVCDHS